LLPAPPPCFDRYIFSGLYNCKSHCTLLSFLTLQTFMQITTESIYLSKRGIHNRMNDSWLQIQQYSSGNVVFIICLQLQRQEMSSNIRLTSNLDKQKQTRIVIEIFK
jgi:hypothetical protein